MHCALAAAVLLSAAPRVDWSVFPEGVTTLKVSSANNRQGSTSERVYAVTRKGTSIELEVREKKEKKMRAGPPTESAQRFTAPTLSEPARDFDGQSTRSFDCTKRKVLVHSADLHFDPHGPEECEGAFLKARSRSPKTVEALSCVLVADGARDPDQVLIFVPGKTVESLFEDNDCTKSAGLRFPPGGGTAPN